MRVVICVAYLSSVIASVFYRVPYCVVFYSPLGGNNFYHRLLNLGHDHFQYLRSYLRRRYPKVTVGVSFAPLPGATVPKFGCDIRIWYWIFTWPGGTAIIATNKMTVIYQFITSAEWAVFHLFGHGHFGTWGFQQRMSVFVDINFQQPYLLQNIIFLLPHFWIIFPVHPQFPHRRFTSASLR
jgi:hypothetical protein